MNEVECELAALMEDPEDIHGVILLHVNARGAIPSRQDSKRRLVQRVLEL
jgi:hypothetical protein